MSCPEQLEQFRLLVASRSVIGFGVLLLVIFLIAIWRSK